MKNFLKRNSPIIFSIASMIGVIGVGYTTAKATVKAVKILQMADDENTFYADDFEFNSKELTKKEKIELVAPVYIPSILCVLFTFSCIAGAHICNKKQQAAIISAYMALDKTYKQYASKVKEYYGEDADLNIKKEIIKAKNTTNTVINEDELCLFYDEYSSAYFESTIEHVEKAERAFNEAIRRYGRVNVRYFYELINAKNLYFVENFFDEKINTEIVFTHELTFIDDDLECRIVRMSNITYA